MGSVVRIGFVDLSRRRKALDLFERADKIDGDDRYLEEAEGFYRRAVALDPGFSEAWTNLGNVRFRQGDAGEAERLYRKALELEPKQAQALYNLGYVMLKRGRPKEAAELLEGAVESDSGFADAYFNLGVAQAEAGDPIGARMAFLRYLALDPWSGWAEEAREKLTALDGTNPVLFNLLRKLAQVLMLAHGSKDMEWVDDYERASGSVVCCLCGFEYWRHAAHPLRPWLTILCDQRSVKL